MILRLCHHFIYWLIILAFSTNGQQQQQYKRQFEPPFYPYYIPTSTSAPSANNVNFNNRGQGQDSRSDYNIPIVSNSRDRDRDRDRINPSFSIANRRIQPNSNGNFPVPAASSHYLSYYRNRNHFAKDSPLTRNNDLNTLRPYPLTVQSTTTFPPSKTLPSPIYGGGGGNENGNGNGYGPVYDPNHKASTEQMMQNDQTAFESSTSENGQIIFEEKNDQMIINEYIRPKEPAQVQHNHQNIHHNFKKDGDDNIAHPSLDEIIQGLHKIEGKTVIKPDGHKKFQPEFKDDGSGGKSKTKSKCDKKSDYCDTIDGYPGALLNSVLRHALNPKDFQLIFGDSLDNSSITIDPGVSSRNNLEQETTLCASTEHTIYPKAARNKDNKWMYVVNHEDYIQGVRVEKCLSDGSACLFGDGAPYGYQSFCRQKYIYKKLLALTPDGKTSTDTFRLPSCCVCHVKSSFVSDRTGSSGNSGTSGSETSDRVKISSNDNTSSIKSNSNSSEIFDLIHPKLGHSSDFDTIPDDVMEALTFSPIISANANNTYNTFENSSDSKNL